MDSNLVNYLFWVIISMPIWAGGVSFLAGSLIPNKFISKLVASFFAYLMLIGGLVWFYIAFNAIFNSRDVVGIAVRDFSNIKAYIPISLILIAFSFALGFYYRKNTTCSPTEIAATGIFIAAMMLLILIAANWVYGQFGGLKSGLESMSTGIQDILKPTNTPTITPR